MPDQFPKRGAIPTPRSALAAAVPYSVRVGAPPNSIVIPRQISMWGNDVHGNCVTAEEAFAKACNNPEIFISDDEVIAWATKHGVLEGANLAEVLTWMQNDGFVDSPFTYDDGTHFSVDWTNAATLAECHRPGTRPDLLACPSARPHTTRPTSDRVVRNGISAGQQRGSLHHTVRLRVHILAGATAWRPGPRGNHRNAAGLCDVHVEFHRDHRRALHGGHYARGIAQATHYGDPRR